jgi:cobalt-zinc-cadmium efflux system outer membrane protein
MSFQLAALAALVISCATVNFAQAANRISLDDAVTRVSQNHPELQLVDARKTGLSAELDRAVLHPGMTAGISIENILGSGSVEGFDAAETTLSLASVIERGGKLDARRTLALTRIDSLVVEREARRLDILAEVARRYLAVVAAQNQLRIAEQDIAQRKRTIAGAKARLAAGASPESVVFSAEAALARAELERSRSAMRIDSAKRYLAIMWGRHTSDFEVSVQSPLTLPEIDSLDELAEYLDSNPELLQFVGEQRIREASLRLAESSASADIQWQAGLRHYQETGDLGLTGALYMPLGSSRRAEPEIRMARSDLELLALEKEVKELSLLSILTESHNSYQAAQLEVDRLQKDIIPRLQKAETAAEKAYRSGAISYLEWAQLQSETTASRKLQLEAALDAHRALIELQRLTGQALVSQAAAY